jgi:2-alkyl-3-oxoalkanoate reductase
MLNDKTANTVQAAQQRILVLGANGFIGRAVVAALASSGWAAPLLGVRRASPLPGGPEQRMVDATVEDSVLRAAQGASAIVNCVAGNAPTLVESAKAACAAAARMNPPPRLIHLSTMSVYGTAVGLIDEETPLKGDLGPYSEAKVTAERAAAAYHRCVIVRPGCVFGPRSEQWSIRIARLLQARRLGDLGAAGDGFCNLVHVEDVATAVLQALQRPATDGRVYNLSTPQPPTWNQFLVSFAIALGAVPVRRIGRRRLRIETKLLAPPLKIAEILGRAVGVPAHRLPPPLPPSLLRLMAQEIRLDTRRAEAELGLCWRTLDVSLAEAARAWLSS